MIAPETALSLYFALNLKAREQIRKDRLDLADAAVLFMLHQAAKFKTAQGFFARLGSRFEAAARNTTAAIQAARAR